MLENQVELPRMQCKHILHWGEYFWCMLQLFKDQQGCSTNQCSLRSVKLCRSQTMKLGVNFTRLTEGSIFFFWCTAFLLPGAQWEVRNGIRILDFCLSHKHCFSQKEISHLMLESPSNCGVVHLNLFLYGLILKSEILKSD